jgi:hypothetical protein
MYERKEWGSYVVDLSILTHNRLRGCVSCKKGESCGVESQGRKKGKKNGGDVATSREQFPATILYSASIWFRRETRRISSAAA